MTSHANLGIYYQTFIPIANIPAEVPLFAKRTSRNMQGVATITFSILPRQPFPPRSAAVYLRVERASMDQHLGLGNNDGNGCADGHVGGGGPRHASLSVDGVDADDSTTDDVQYTAVDGAGEGGGASDDVYANTNSQDGDDGNNDDDDDNIEYTAIDHVAVADRKDAALAAAKSAAARFAAEDGGGGGGAPAPGPAAVGMHRGDAEQRPASYSLPHEHHQTLYDGLTLDNGRGGGGGSGDSANRALYSTVREDSVRQQAAGGSRPLSVVNEAPYSMASQASHPGAPAAASYPDIDDEAGANSSSTDYPNVLRNSANGGGGAGSHYSVASPEASSRIGAYYQPGGSETSAGTHYSVASPEDAASYQSIDVHSNASTSVESAMSWNTATVRRGRANSAGVSGVESDGPLPPIPSHAQKPTVRRAQGGQRVGAAAGAGRGSNAIKSTTGSDYTPSLAGVQWSRTNAAAAAPVVVKPVEMQYKAVARDGGAIAPDSAPLWLHVVDKAEATKLLRAAGGMDGLFLVRPLDLKKTSLPKHIMSVVAKKKMFHQIIERKSGGAYVVTNGANNVANKVPSGGWGANLEQVVTKIQVMMERELKIGMIPVPNLSVDA